MNTSSPMSVEHYSAKLEFQGRGAAHNHGVLWINLDKMEFMMKKLDKNENDHIDYSLMNFEDLFHENEYENKQFRQGSPN